jgi:TolB-like protein/Flp pilus assembly protein TadD
LLDGLHLSTTPEFERWVDDERGRLRRRAHTGARELAEAAERCGQGARAAHWLRVALNLYPDDEASLQSLMRSLDRAGDRAGALRAYELFAERLASEFDVEPSPESRAALAEIRARVLGSHPSAFAADGDTPKPILVLPFTNNSGAPENEYFADGLTEEIITDLSMVHALRVISRTSAMRLKGTTKDLRTIARELEVQYVLEGSVRRSGNDLRVSAQLIDATRDTHVWAQKYSGTLDDVFRIQETLSRAIVDALKITLSADESDRLGERSLDNAQAYECYLQARQAIWTFSPAALDHATRLIDRALSIVGDDPLLYATKAYLAAHHLHSGGTLEDGYLEKAQECVARAFALAPHSYHGHLARGLLLHFEGDFQGAVRDLKQVLVVNPNDPVALLMLGYTYALSGREAAAKPLHDRLIQVDPLTPLNYAVAGFVSYLEGHPEETLAPYRRYYELAGDDAAAHWFYAWALALNGQADDLNDVVKRIVELAPNTVFARAGVFLQHAVRGQRRKTLAAVTPELRAAARGAELFSREIGRFLALVGEKDEAITWLENANRLGFTNYPFLAERDRFLETIRQEPRFQRLLDRVRRQWDAFEV